MVVIVRKSAKNKRLDKLIPDKILRSQKPRKPLNAKKYCGVIKVKGNPLTIQRKLRNEWS